jgi:hypothetical protein
MLKCSANSAYSQIGNYGMVYLLIILSDIEETNRSSMTSFAGDFSPIAASLSRLQHRKIKTPGLPRPSVEFHAQLEKSARSTLSIREPLPCLLYLRNTFTF